jgi:acetolactate synthase regulatory subunit
MPTGLGGFVFLGARMESYVMTVVCRSHPSALARIVSVLHARRADITALHYAGGPDTAEVVVHLGGGDAGLLATQVERCVDVVSVQVARPVGMAVAS